MEVRKCPLFHLHCCATGRHATAAANAQQWLGSCIARLPAHYCCCAAAMVAAAAGAQVANSSIFVTSCCFVAQLALRVCDSIEAVRMPSRKLRNKLMPSTVLTGAGAGGQGGQVRTFLAKATGKAGRCEGQHSGSSSSVGRCVHCKLSKVPNTV